MKAEVSWLNQFPGVDHRAEHGLFPSKWNSLGQRCKPDPPQNPQGTRSTVILDVALILKWAGRGCHWWISNKRSWPGSITSEFSANCPPRLGVPQPPSVQEVRPWTCGLTWHVLPGLVWAEVGQCGAFCLTAASWGPLRFPPSTYWLRLIGR